MGLPGVQTETGAAQKVAFVRRRHWSYALAARLGAALLSLACVSGCQLSSDPPRARIEAALPSLLQKVSGMTEYGPSAERTSESGTEEVLRIAMASCVRFYCLPDDIPNLARGQAPMPELTSPDSQLILLDFRSPEDVPTALPLSGWFGPLRGYEAMRQVERLAIILERGQWAEVVARHTDGTWSCWKSNWASESP
jgi:hypothetical protein